MSILIMSFKETGNKHNFRFLQKLPLQARSQVLIGGGGGFSGESGPFCIFFVKKVDFFAYFLGKGGLFCILSGRKWTFSLVFLEESGPFCTLFE